MALLLTADAPPNAASAAQHMTAAHSRLVPRPLTILGCTRNTNSNAPRAAADDAGRAIGVLNVPRYLRITDTMRYF